VQAGILFDGANNSLTIPNSYKYTTLDCGSNGKYSTDSHMCVCNVGYAGPTCDACDIPNGYTNPDGYPQLCVKNACQASTCGCLDPSCATTLGSCRTNVSGMAQCSCGNNYQGDHCEACAPGFANWPKCSRYQPCPDCVPGHGTCVISTAACQCTSHWSGSTCEVCPGNFVQVGDTCDQCASGYSGANCDNPNVGGGTDWGATETFLKVMAVIVSVALVVGAAFWFWRRRLSGSRYKLVSRFSMDDDDEEAGHRFLDQDNRLVDDDDELPQDNERDHEGSNNEEHHDDEPAAQHEPESNNVVLPSPAGSVNSEPFSNSRLVDM